MIALLGLLVFLLYGAIAAQTAWMWTRATKPRTLIGQLAGSPISREEVVTIASSYAEHTWTASAANVKHGPDAHGVDVQTPDTNANPAEPGKWHIGKDNIGMPYKWGGFDTPESFDAGVVGGKAAGDMYSATKRRRRT